MEHNTRKNYIAPGGLNQKLTIASKCKPKYNYLKVFQKNLHFHLKEACQQKMLLQTPFWEKIN